MKYKIFIVALLALALASCKHNHEEENHEEEVKIQFTAYSNAFEVFAEADPFIVSKKIGNTVSLLTFAKLFGLGKRKCDSPVDNWGKGSCASA